jgi:hypothetical protein
MVLGNPDYKDLYFKGRKKFQTQAQIPTGVIDPLIIKSLEDDDLIEDPMFWHLIDVWRWLIKFDSALSRCSTLTRREQELCRNFERKRITNPYASIYASKFITYLLVNKWMIVGSDQPEVMIGLIQVLILIVSNFAFDDSSYQKLAEIGIPIKGFPILAAFAVIKQADPGYGYFLQELRKKKIDDTKFNFVKATNFVAQKIFNEWNKKLEKMRIAGDDSVTRDDEQEAQLGYGDGINLTNIPYQFVSVIGQNLTNKNFFTGSDIYDLIKGKPYVPSSNQFNISFNDETSLQQFYYSSFFTAYLTEFFKAITGVDYISFERAQSQELSKTDPPAVSEYPQIDFSDILKLNITLNMIFTQQQPATNQNSVKINTTKSTIEKGDTEFIISNWSVGVLFNGNEKIIFQDGKIVFLSQTQSNAVMSADELSKTLNSFKDKTYLSTYSWSNKMDLFSRTLLTQFEPSAIKQIVDLSNEKAFALLLALFAQSGTKPKGIDQLKKTVKTYKEMMTLEDDNETDYKKLKRESQQPWGNGGYRKSRSGGRRKKSRSGGRGGRKKRSYGRRH